MRGPGLELHQVTPGLAGRFLDELPHRAPTKNQALAALRHFFDVLVARHAAVLNPFQSVRGVRHPFGEGRTPEATVEQARQLLASIKTDRVYGLRDRAVLGTLIYTGARVGAISRLRMQDLRDNGNHRSLQFSEKGGKSREIPVRHDLDEWIAAYLEGAGLTDAPQASPLFRAGRAPLQPVDRSGDVASRRAADAQAPAASGRVAEDPLAPLVPGPGGHGSAEPERAAGGRPVPGRARPPPHHPDLRPAPPARHPQPGRSDLRLKGGATAVAITQSFGKS